MKSNKSTLRDVVGLFDNIKICLKKKFPHQLDCEIGNRVHANGLYIKNTSRTGFGFVFEPYDDGNFLFEICQTDDDENPEVWRLETIDELCEHIGLWLNPRKWMAPDAVNQVKEKKRLQKIKDGIVNRTTIPCELANIELKLDLLSKDSQEQLTQDIKQLALDRIVEHFPWDKAGRLLLKTNVLLNVYETVSSVGQGRDLCLVASGPDRRSDEQNIVVQLIDLIVLNQSHQWDRKPWLWTTADIPEIELMGSDLASMKDNKNAVKSLRFLQEGKVMEALNLYNINLEDDVYKLLGGQKISPPACCAHTDEKWTDLLVYTLRQSAPWLLPLAVKNESERLKKWAAEKNSRRIRDPYLKFFIFPGQHHARKASLVLTSDKNGDNPKFIIDDTASNTRLHDTAWKCPLNIQFEQFGIKTHN